MNMMTHIMSEYLWAFSARTIVLCDCFFLFEVKGQKHLHVLRLMNMDVYLHNNSWFNNTRFALHQICIWHKICLIMADHSRSLAIEREVLMNLKWSFFREFFALHITRMMLIESENFIAFSSSSYIKIPFWGRRVWMNEIHVKIFRLIFDIMRCGVEIDGNQNYVFLLLKMMTS